MKDSNYLYRLYIYIYYDYKIIINILILKTQGTKGTFLYKFDVFELLNYILLVIKFILIYYDTQGIKF